MSLMPTIYRSTDAGAPSLSGQPGALAALLDAVLVDGYGTGAGAKTGLGWTREFLSPNKRVYRNNVVTGSGYYLRLDDANAQYGLLRGFESMSDVDNGGNAVPTVAQMTNGCLWPKSSTASATERPWFAIGTERCFYLFIRHTGISGQDAPHFAGDLASYVADDQHSFCVSNTKLTSYSSGFGMNVLFMMFAPDLNAYPVNSNTGGIYIARSSAGAAAPQRLTSWSPYYMGRTMVPYGGMAGTIQVPEQVNKGVFAVPGQLLERLMVFRGEYPGLLLPFSSLSYSDGTYLEGQTTISKRFSCTSETGTSPLEGEVLFDLARAWH